MRLARLIAITAMLLCPATMHEALSMDPRDVFREGPLITELMRACGEVGQSCCSWPNALPGFNPSYCKAGAGCDITSNTCVAPCGGAGQACCDGPDTYAPQGDSSPTSPLYCTSVGCTWRKQMCDSAACTRDTRRCDANCGKTIGGACCPPDAGLAVASCKLTDTVCEFTSTRLDAGVCVQCGEQGMPPCPGSGCKVSGGLRTMERDGVCVACGYVSGPKCPDRPRCDAGAAPDPNSDRCIAGGGENQPCLEGRMCGYDGMYCDEANTCRICGSPGKPCCPQQPLLGGGHTLQCGGYSNLQCAPHGPLGVCQYKPGSAPGEGAPPPPPPPPPRTCGGELYDFGVTNTWPVWIRQWTGCAIVGTQFQANSYPEAVQCGRSIFGDAVIEEPVEPYTFSMDGPFGCSTVHVYARDEEDGQSCAQAHCINCGEPQLGSCP